MSNGLIIYIIFRQPSNAISGIFKGTTILIGSILSGVAGLVTEPVKGAKAKGFKGATIGVGKGLLGLVCKPVAGGIDMVTLTTRGIGNTPKTIYNGATKVFRRKVKGVKIEYKYPPIRPYVPDDQEDENENQSDNEIYLGEDGEGSIYVDKKELKKVLIENNLIDNTSLDLLSDYDNLNINLKLRHQRSQVEQKYSEYKNREEDKEELKMLHQNLRRRAIGEKDQIDGPSMVSKGNFETSKDVDMMGFPSKESIEIGQDQMTILYDLIRKKKLARIEQSEPSESDFVTAKDYESEAS